MNHYEWIDSWVSNHFIFPMPHATITTSMHKALSHWTELGMN